MDDPSVEFHGVYDMDNNILIRAYEALNGRGRMDPGGRAKAEGSYVTLISTMCNGAQELLESGKQ